MQKDDATWLRTGYAISLLIVAFVFWKAFMFAGLRTGLLEQNEPAFNAGSVILSGVLSGAIVWWLARDEERHSYFLACIAELRKVHWPTVENTKKLTWIVVIVVAIFSVILTGFDWVWAMLWSGLLKMMVV
jgi:preprotein translocase SecE subunit